MKVKMKTLSAGPGGVTHPGQLTNDLPRGEAYGLIERGYAEQDDKPKPSIPTDPPEPPAGDEETADKTAPETAATRPAKGQRKAGRKKKK